MVLSELSEKGTSLERKKQATLQAFSSFSFTQQKQQAVARS
jgi:hypothetical protein